MSDQHRLSQDGRLALVLGATGSAGRAIVQALLAHDWRVRVLHRRPEQAQRDETTIPVSLAALSAVPGSVIEWVQGDAADLASVTRAAAGAAIIFHGVNPPGYRKWRELGIPMLANAISAAKTSGARLIFPGNVYNFDPAAGALINENSPQAPITRKGAVRIEMEQLLAAAAQDGARSLIVRAGDFFGPGAATSWLHAAMVKVQRPARSVIYPGDYDIGHAWAYLPDYAETVARLAAIETQLPAFDAFHFGGHWIDPGVEMARCVCRALADPNLPIKPMRWGALRLGAPFSGFLRELLELRYLWRVPLRLDNRKLVELIGHEPNTPRDEAVQRSLQVPPRL